MLPPFLLQLGVSAVLIALMIAVAAVARISRPTGALDDAAVRRLLADDYPDVEADAVWISTDGRAGLAAAGDLAMVVFQLGDGYVTRDLPWRDLQHARRTGRGIRISFSGPGGGLAHLIWPGTAAWPPERQ